MTNVTCRRSRFLLRWLARLVVLAYVFQLTAVDHWHLDPAADVTGVEGSARHVAHCHGDPAGCSDGTSGLTGTFAEASLTPLPPAATRVSALDAPASIIEAFLPTPDQPPRAA